MGNVDSFDKGIEQFRDLSPAQKVKFLEQRDKIIKLFLDNSKDLSSLEIARALYGPSGKKNYVSTTLRIMDNEFEIAMVSRSGQGNIRWQITPHCLERIDDHNKNGMFINDLHSKKKTNLDILQTDNEICREIDVMLNDL